MVKVKFDLRLYEARSESKNLGRVLDLLENQVRFLTDQKKTQAQADLDRLSAQGLGWEDANVQAIMQERDYELQNTYPRLFRGAFLTVTWATYESGVREVAEFIQRNGSVKLSFDEIAGRGFLRRARRYFEAVLHIDLLTNVKHAGELGKLYAVRNAFVHGGGRVSAVAPEVKRTLRSLEGEGHFEEHWGWFVPSEAYVHRAAKLVQGELSGLVKRTLAWHDARREVAGRKEPPS